MLRAADKRRMVGAKVIDVFGGRYAALANDIPLDIYRRTILADSPRGYWPLQDDSGNLLDVSGNAFDMTTVSGLPFYRCPRGNAEHPYALGFNNASGGGSVSRSSSIVTVFNNISFEMWIYLTGSPTGIATPWSSAAGSTNRWEVRLTTARKVDVIVQGIALEADSTAALATEVWNHVVIVRDATIWKYYINGSIDTANAGNATPSGTTGLTRIMDATGVQTFYRDIAYYESALSSSQVSAHYNAGL